MMEHWTSEAIEAALTNAPPEPPRLGRHPRSCTDPHCRSNHTEEKPMIETFSDISVRVSIELGPVEYIDVPTTYGHNTKWARLLRLTLTYDPLTGHAYYTGGGKYLTKDGRLGQVNYHTSWLGADRIPERVRDFLLDRARAVLATASQEQTS